MDFFFVTRRRVQGTLSARLAVGRAWVQVQGVPGTNAALRAAHGPRRLGGPSCRLPSCYPLTDSSPFRPLALSKPARLAPASARELSPSLKLASFPSRRRTSLRTSQMGQGLSIPHLAPSSAPMASVYKARGEDLKQQFAMERTLPPEKETYVLRHPASYRRGSRGGEAELTRLPSRCCCRACGPTPARVRSFRASATPNAELLADLELWPLPLQSPIPGLSSPTLSSARRASRPCRRSWAAYREGHACRRRQAHVQDAARAAQAHRAAVHDAPQAAHGPSATQAAVRSCRGRC